MPGSAAVCYGKVWCGPVSRGVLGCGLVIGGFSFGRGPLFIADKYTMRFLILLAFLSSLAWGQKTVMPYPNQQWLDTNGNPLSGSKLYTCVAGQSCSATSPPSNPQTTYIDETGGTPNSNPVVANSAGRMNVWLVPGLSYRLDLYTSTGVLVWSVDNVLSPALSNISTCGANLVVSGPTVGSPAAPTCRSLVAADMPTLTSLYADLALDNLASVSINTSLLAQTGVDIGSTVKPFRNLFLFGGGTYGTNYFELTGTPTSTRVLTLPNTTDTLVGKATTDTFTNKAFDTGGTGNTFFINGTSITAVEGNSAKVALFTGSNPATNNCAKFDVNHNLVDAGAACGGTGTVSSIATTGPIGGGTITTTGTITCTTCVTSAASLTSTAIMTGAGSQGSQTPNSSATMDSSGNISTPGTITTGVGGSLAGFDDFGSGTPHTATGVGFQGPGSISVPFMMTLPSAPATGFILNTGVSDPSAISFVAGTGSGNVVRATLPVMVTPVIPPILFASITACNGGTAGAIQTVSDSSTNTWGATITGSGGNTVMAFCNSVNWTVIGK